MPIEFVKYHEFSIDVETIICKEDNYTVIYCPSLDFSAYGKTIDETVKAFEEQIKTFLKELHNKNKKLLDALNESITKD